MQNATSAAVTFRLTATDADGCTTFRSGLTAAQAVEFVERLENEGRTVAVFVGTTDRRISALTVCRLALGESIDWWLQASA